ncbi:MAG: pyruvate kinase, partial [Alphaproteobacteria bacterium]
MRKTKIICTLGPATESTGAIRELIEKGTDVFRVNMSHATHEWVSQIVPRIRTLGQKAGRPVGVLLDTQGPAIRTGDLKTNIHLKPGDILEFTVRGAKSKAPCSVDVNYPGFANDVAVGNAILVDNGLIKLVVLEKGRDRVRTRVL